jgi:S1-C subfamily serine protease
LNQLERPTFSPYPFIEPDMAASPPPPPRVIVDASEGGRHQALGRPAESGAKAESEAPEALWNMACAGQTFEAYWSLVEQTERSQAAEEVYLQLYWLLFAQPELDRGRKPVDWLCAALRSQAGGWCSLELLRREFSIQPREALAKHWAAIVHDGLRPERLEALVSARWRSARLLRKWDTVLTDIQALRTRLVGHHEAILFRLLIAAAENLAWCEGTERDAARFLSREADQLLHPNEGPGDALLRLDYAMLVSDAWLGLRLEDGPAARWLVYLLPNAWDAPLSAYRAPLLAYLKVVADRPLEMLPCLDNIHGKYPALIAFVGELIAQLRLHEGIKAPSQSMPRLARKVGDFFTNNPERDMRLLRPLLLEFCIAETIDPQDMARALEDRGAFQDHPGPGVVHTIAADKPLRHVYQACATAFAWNGQSSYEPAAPLEDMAPSKSSRRARRRPTPIVARIAATVLITGLLLAAVMLRPPAPPPRPPTPPTTTGGPAATGPDGLAPGAQPSVRAADYRGIHQALADADATGKPLSTAEIAEQSKGSIALVKGRVSSGTGFVIAPGVLATNSHVIADEFVNQLEILFPSGEGEHGPFQAELLYENPMRDLAFLKFKGDVPRLRIASAFRDRMGEDVTVIENPSDGPDQVLENRIGRGAMIGKVTIDKQEFYPLAISLGAGNAGGPVFDSAGRVVGMIALQSPDQAGVALCIPIDDLRAAMQALPGQSASSIEVFQSKHRVACAFKALARGGALYVLGAYARRGGAGPGSARGDDAPDELLRFDEVISEMEKRQFCSLDTELAAIRSDGRLGVHVRQAMVELCSNFQELQRMYSGAGQLDVGDAQLSTLRTNHRRLIEQLASSIGVELPKQMMLVLQDEPPAPDTTTFAASWIRSPQRGVRGPSVLGPPRPPSAPNPDREPPNRVR